MYNFPYLNDTSFLKQFDEIKLKEKYAKIVVLTFKEEKPITEIQGIVTGGNITLDGSSAVRRTCNISVIANSYENNLADTRHLLSINKKIQLLIGFKNITDKYLQYPILWFPQGVFLIISPNITRDSNGINISLTLHDKMALLNGQCGGVFPTSVILNEIDRIGEDGNGYIEQITIFQIIQQLVNHWGGEQIGKILINDIDLKLKRVVQWTGTNPIFFYYFPVVSANGTVLQYYTYSTNKEDLIQQILSKESSIDQDKIIECNYGDNIGYILSDFIYQGQLVANAGETVTSILDKIKNMLGNYEYFYDINGNFVFRQIRNFLNTTYATRKINQIQNNTVNDLKLKINSLIKENYLVDYTSGKAVYSFDDGHLILSYNNNPKYDQIKNDFMVWGVRQEAKTGLKFPIRYHLAIDEKPVLSTEPYQVFFYTDDDGIEQAKMPLKYDKRTIQDDSEENTISTFPKQGQIDMYYYDESTEEIYRWNPDAPTGRYVETDLKKETAPSTPISYESKNKFPTTGKINVYYYDELTTKIWIWEDYVKKGGYVLTDYKLQYIYPTDYRTELYMQGLQAELLGLQKTFYFTQLKNEWCKIYDVRAGKFKEEFVEHPETLNYFLDIIDTDSSLNELNVNNIGRRTNIINSQNINCLFEPDFLNIVFIQAGTDQTDELQKECEQMQLEYIQVDSETYSKFATGGYLNSAYEQIKNEIYQYTNYNEQISLNTIPIYYLQPNSRIAVRDTATGIYGDFIIKNISLPLDVNGTMSISCIKALERI